jgi:hypothetical protein
MRRAGDQLSFSHEEGTHTNGSIVEIGEWDESANVDESSTIEEQIDDVGEHCVFGILVEESIPCECGSASECRE